MSPIKRNNFYSDCEICGKTFSTDLKNKGIRTWCSEPCRKRIFRKPKPIKISRNIIPLKLRFSIMERDGFRCHYCGANPHINPDIRLVLDHIIPLSKSGKDIESNLITSCEQCNYGKTDREIQFPL